MNARRRPQAWQVVAALGAAATAGYFAVPGVVAQDLWYNGIGLAAVVLIVVGIFRNRPADRASWWLLAVGNLMFVVADGILSWYDAVHRTAPFPSLADPIYLAAYPLLFCAVLRLAHRSAGRGSRERWTDAAIVGLGALALSWHFVIDPQNADGSVSLLGQLTLDAYPIMDVAIVFIVVYGMALTGTRRTSDRLVALSMATMLVADVVYDVLVLHNQYQSGDAIDAGWLISYVLVGVAALHPSMATGTALGRGRERRLGWLPASAIAGFVAPGLLLGYSLAGTRVDVPVLAGISLVLAGLSTARMSWLFGRLREHAGSLMDALHAREALEADLRHQAFHDSLTGLANRALLLDRIEHALAGAQRDGRVVALLLCDLDGFKTVNDSLGHLAGDALLTATGARMSGVVRGADTVARLGGDEFAVLIEHVADTGEARALAERLVSVLHRPVTVDDTLITLSASIGVTFGAGDVTAEQLLAEADAAMYEAKSRGKNRYALFETTMRSRAVERLTLVNAFDGALERGEFYVEFQPHFALSGGELEGFEALVRWNHPTLGPLSPARFIPTAEETGFIVTLGRWVLRQACARAMQWPGTLSVAVNLSARQLRDPGLASDVAAALTATGLPPRRLVLELTESLLATSDGIPVLSRLRSTGVRVAIDDFGTGYSSLAALRSFPVDVLKIDRTFVETLGGADGDGDAFVAMIINLAHELGLATVAEGVELEVQRTTLAALGCDSGQGYLMSRPLAADAADWLARRLASHLPAPGTRRHEELVRETEPA